MNHFRPSWPFIQKTFVDIRPSHGKILKGKGIFAKKMKRNSCLLVLALSLILSGCGPASSSENGPSAASSSSSSSASGATSSSLSSSESVSSSTSSESVDVDANKKAIVDFLNNAEKGDNYTYGYLNDAGIVYGKTILTPDYIAYPDSKSARVALPSYEGGGKKLLYDVDQVDGKYSIIAATTYVDSITGETCGYHSTDELDYLALLKRDDVAWGTDALFEQSGHYMSEDENIIAIFANMFGLANYTDYVMRVLFGLDGNELNIGFVPNYRDSDGSSSSIVEATAGMIYKVGTSVEEEVAAFAESYEMPSESLSDESLVYLKGDKVTYAADLTLYLDTAVADTPAKAVFSYDYPSKRAKVVDSSLGSPEVSYYAANGEGKLVEQILNPENELVEINEGVGYDEWVPDLIDLLDAKAFLKVDDTTYRYYGYKSDRLVKGLTGAVDGMGLVVDMEAKVDENGRLVEVDATSRDVIIEGSGTYRYKMKLTFGTPETIEEVDVYKDEGDERIKTALNALTSVGDGYSITAYREGFPAYFNKLTAKDDVILRESVASDLYDGAVTTYDGYYYEDGIAPFKVDEGKASLYDEADAEYSSVDDFLGLKAISPLTLEFDNDGYIVPRAFVKGFKDLLPLGPNGDLMDETTLRFAYDEESGRISGYFYDVPGLKSERADIVYGVSLPSDIDFTGLDESFAVPTNWKDGCPWLYDDLVAVDWIGEKAAEIPYLYDPVLNDYWFFGSKGGTTYTEAHLTNNCFPIGSEYAAEYMHRYEEHLGELGFEAGQGTPTRYHKEGLPFVICIGSYGDDALIDIWVRNIESYPFVPLA